MESTPFQAKNSKRNSKTFPSTQANTPFRFSLTATSHTCGCQFLFQMQPQHFKVDSKHIYIGSTKEGLPKREWNRISKYKQVTQEQLVHVEPAIRYWARNNTFYQHTVLVLSAHDTYQQAWCFEHLLIQRWQPHLNYPHILRHFRRKSNSFVRLAVQHRSSVLHTGVRLWRKLRKHTFCSVAMFQQHTMERLQA